jgi:hypothetical protein
MQPDLSRHVSIATPAPRNAACCVAAQDDETDQQEMVMRKTVFCAAGLAALTALAACGTNPQSRTTGGAAAGAATGAGVGAIAGPPGMALGAAVGAGAGGIAGGATQPSQLNLGAPPWDNPETRVPTPNGPVAPNTSSSNQ